MSETITIKCEKRTLTSKGANRALRKEGKVPATIYGKKGTANLIVNLREIPKSHTHTNVIELDVEGEKKTVLMKEVQVNRLNGVPTHFDFQEVESSDVVFAKVPVKYEGFTRDQEKIGMFRQLVDTVKVKSEVAKLPVEFTVNVSHLKGDESVYAKLLNFQKAFHYASTKVKF